MAQPHKRAITSRRLPRSRHSALPLSGKRAQAMRWTKSEDERLISLRENEMTWKDIAEQLPSRTAIACRLHYRNYLTPKNNKPNDQERRAGTVPSSLCISTSPEPFSASDMQHSSSEYALADSTTGACDSSEKRSVVSGRPAQGPEMAPMVPGSQAQGSNKVVLPSFMELDKTLLWLGLTENRSAWQKFRLEEGEARSSK